MSTKISLKSIPKSNFVLTDLFCGGGGTSTGATHALNDLGIPFSLIAINHWSVAIATHTKNHPDAVHRCQSIDTINPLDVVPGGRLKLLMASPECTHHSRARGGKPMSDQKRADAWLLMRWIQNLYVENLMIENVEEFVDWGPLSAKGKPDKRYKGQYFRQFIAWLEINYSVKYAVLNAADYGDATTRKRFILIAKRGKGKTIHFPEPTHTSRAKLAQKQPSLLNGGKELLPWKPARDIIDWSLKGTSIFGRKKPLSINTMRRIFAGLFKYSLKDFIVNLKGTKRRCRSVDEPTVTQTTNANQQMLIEPFLTQFFGERIGQEPRTRNIEEPVWTITAQGRMGIAEGEAFIINSSHTQNNDAGMCASIDNPMKTICGKAMLSFVEPYFVKYYTGSDAVSVDDPLPTVTADYEHIALTQPVLLKYHGNENGTHSVDEPLSTITTKDRVGVAEPYIVPCNHGKNDTRSHSVDEPMKTITQVDAWGMAIPFLVRFQNNQDAASVDEPVGTLTTQNKFGLCEAEFLSDKFTPDDGEIGLCIPQLGLIVFIRFRMLQPHELAAAMSFPKDYHFVGTRENKVKQIGNAVPVELSRACVRSIFKNLQK